MRSEPSCAVFLLMRGKASGHAADLWLTAAARRGPASRRPARRRAGRASASGDAQRGAARQRSGRHWPAPRPHPPGRAPLRRSRLDLRVRPARRAPAAQRSPLVFRGAAPYPGLASFQRPLKTLVTGFAVRAYRLGPRGLVQRGAGGADGKEEVRVLISASSSLAPMHYRDSLSGRVDWAMSVRGRPAHGHGQRSGGFLPFHKNQIAMLTRKYFEA